MAREPAGDLPLSANAQTLPAGATLGAAAALVGSTYAPRIPVIGDDGRVAGILTEEDIRLGLAGRGRPHHELAPLLRSPDEFPEITADWTPSPPLAVRRALLMAGGRGSRLAPLTDAIPKPLLEVDGGPLLHRLLGQVKAAGIETCYVSVHYLARQVRRSVGDGSAFGLTVEYVEETTPLGTAGALGLLPEAEGPLLVMNGDILSDVHLPSLFGWHERHGNRVTVATHLYEVDVPFGLAHFDGQRLERLEEKPTLRLPVNAGVYLFDGALLSEVPDGQPFDMVTWLNEVSARGEAGQFPIVERWHDIGSLEEYERLQG